MLPCVVALALLGAEPAGEDRPFVEILQSTGAIDGPGAAGAGAPRWERMRVELEVINRLPSEVGELDVEVTLVSSSGAGEAAATPIPGWRFEQTFTEDVIPPEEQAFLRIDRPLAPRRRSPPADEIAYRPRIRGYRVLAPDLDLAARMLGSSAWSDQRAALKSFELDPEAPDADKLIPLVAAQLRRALSDLPRAPTASDGLRLMLAIRAAGAVGDPSLVERLLTLPGRVQPRAFGAAVVDLASRIWQASEEGEPRLEILPKWARESQKVLALRSEDAVKDAVRDAIVRMGDPAVPELLRASRLDPSPEVRAFALGLLSALGRSTVRSELMLSSRPARIRVIEVFGEIGSPEAVPALIEVVAAREGPSRAAAIEALRRIGAPAIEPLVAALSTRDSKARRALHQLLVEIGAKNRVALVEAASKYGVVIASRTPIETIADKLSEQLEEEGRERWEAEVARGLELGREGSYDEAFRILAEVELNAPDVHRRSEEAISRVYLQRAQALLTRGNFDAALGVAQKIRASKEKDELVLQAQIALARGYLELDDLAGAANAIKDADPAFANPEVKTVRAKLLGRQAEMAYAGGDFGSARTLLDRARALAPEAPELVLFHRRLMLSENIAIVVAVALVVPLALLSFVIVVRRRMQAARMQELADALDRTA